MKSNRNNRANSRRQRHGVAIIVVIAFYAVAVTMLGVWIRTSLGRQRQSRLLHEKTQTTWLADAGVRRAAARLATDANYTGEQWLIAAEQLGGMHAAAVEIRIEAIEPTGETKEQDDGSAKRVRIVATAEIPAGTGRHVRRSKSTEVNLAKLN